MAVRIDRQLHNIDCLLSQHTLNGGADLPFVEHDGLRMEDAPAREHMRVDPDGRRLAAWIESRLPNPLPGLQTHHVGGGQIRAAPCCRNRMTTQVTEHGRTGFCQSSFITGPTHRLPDARRRKLRHHARRLGRRHRGTMRQDAGIHHQQFPVGTRLATEHDPAEAHVGIDLEQQLRQLRFADPMIERGAQLDQLGLLLLGRQGRQMQLIVDA
jgi:hypothetical protein